MLNNLAAAFCILFGMASSAPPTLPTIADYVGNDAPKNKRLNYRNWEIVALVFTGHAICVSKPQSTVMFRSTFMRTHYQKYAAQCLSMYGLMEELEIR